MSILPSLPKNVISEFGNNLKAKIEQQINKLVDESVINEVDREAAFQKVKQCYSCSLFITDILDCF